MTTGFLLDTNVLSETARQRPAPQVLDFLARLNERQTFVSAVTLAELERGVHLSALQDLRRAQRLRQWLERVVTEHGERILPFDAEAARSWGLLTGNEAARRQPPARFDSLIAATAHAHRLTLATRNTADFLAFPVAVVNPWEPR